MIALAVACAVFAAAGGAALWVGVAMMRAAHAVRHEADRNLSSVIARHDAERGRLLDRIARYDGKQTPVYPESTPKLEELEKLGDITANLEGSMVEDEFEHQVA